MMNMKKIKIGNSDILKDGEMKAVEIGGENILLSRIDGKFYGTAAFCTHYGASLEEGVLSGERIVCPWHHACFHAKTGDLQEPPARDALPHFDITVEGDEIFVNLPEKVELSRTPQMVKMDHQKDKRIFVILGGGAAGNAAAQSLRENGYIGRLIMISYEDRLPYDRPNLSKDYLKGEAEAEWMPLRSADFYRDYGIGLHLNQRVIEVNIPTNLILMENQQDINYDKLLIVTGGIPRIPEIPGIDLNNIFTLRSYDDSDAIIKAAESASRAVILGASFIGMETADSLRHRGLSVTVVAPENVPFENIFGEEVGNMFLEAHRENGVAFHLGQTVKKFEGENKVRAVLLENGKRLETDLVIVGIGVRPATEVIKGLKINGDGSLSVDKYFQVNENVYAAGDIARFNYWRTGEDVRIEHWRVAEQTGRLAGANMAGKNQEYQGVPFFWTAQAGFNFRYIGHARNCDDIIVDGDIKAKQFIAYYIKNKMISAAAGINRDQEIAAIEELMRRNLMPSPEDLRKKKIDLLDLI
jgi:NADPH-dependent 2,4-dienoyl-CoA reductase/sulfur reductase-like enzyme/nitrite reductase/ring-hydroxylating ferredoxin subunit